MFFKSKKSEKGKLTAAHAEGKSGKPGNSAAPTPASALQASLIPPPLVAAFSPDLLEVDFSSAPAAVANCLFDVKDGELTVGSTQFWKSEPTLVANEGEVFEIETRARLVRPPSNGALNGFYVGPLIYDADGEVLTWWETVPQVAASEGYRQVLVRAVAAAGAASVGIGICGSWSPDNVPADFVVGFRKVTLKRVKT